MAKPKMIAIPEVSVMERENINPGLGSVHMKPMNKESSVCPDCQKFMKWGFNHVSPMTSSVEERNDLSLNNPENDYDFIFWFSETILNIIIYGKSTYISFSYI